MNKSESVAALKLLKGKRKAEEVPVPLPCRHGLAPHHSASSSKSTIDMPKPPPEALPFLDIRAPRTIMGGGPPSRYQIRQPSYIVDDDDESYISPYSRPIYERHGEVVAHQCQMVRKSISASCMGRPESQVATIEYPIQPSNHVAPPVIHRRRNGVQQLGSGPPRTSPIRLQVVHNGKEDQIVLPRQSSYRGLGKVMK